MVPTREAVLEVGTKTETGAGRTRQMLLSHLSLRALPRWWGSEDLRICRSRASVRLKAGSLFCSSRSNSRKMPSSLWPRKGCSWSVPPPSCPQRVLSPPHPWPMARRGTWGALTMEMGSASPLGSRPHLSPLPFCAPTSQADLMKSVAMVKYQPLFSSIGI